MTKKIVLFGMGGHSKSCIEVFKEKKNLQIYGYLDTIKKNTKYNYLGNDDDILKFVNNFYFFISFAFIKNFKIRAKLIKKLDLLNVKCINLISKDALVSNNVDLGAGIAILKSAYIGPDVSIMDHSIVNTGVIVEHDVKIGRNVHLAPGSIINGSSIIGDNTFVGSGTIISNGVTIGKNVVIGAGLKILKSIKNNSKII